MERTEGQERTRPGEEQKLCQEDWKKGPLRQPDFNFDGSSTGIEADQKKES